VQFLRYSAVGLGATLVHYVVLLLGVELGGCSPAWGSAWGAILGAQVAFIGNRWWTFAPAPRSSEQAASHAPMSSKPAAWVASWLRFQLTAITAAALGVVWLKLGMHAGLYYLLAQMVATAVNLVLTFVVNRYWTYRIHAKQA
jgi:putative flippase GtrA